MELSKATTSYVRKLKDPNIQTELYLSLDFCSVFRNLAQNLSNVAAPLNKKLRTDHLTSFLYSIQAEKEAVENLKGVLTNPPILPLPSATGQYTVNTDTRYSEL